MTLTLDFANRLCRYIEDTLRDYARNFDAYGFQPLPEAPYRLSEALVLASGLSEQKCPKLAAAEKYGLVPERLADADHWKFALAKMAALYAKQAIVRAVREDGAALRDVTGETWDARVEYAVAIRDRAEGPAGLSGTVDLLLSITMPDGVTHRIPVEMKRTDSDFYAGIYPDNVWQTVAYMHMLGSDLGIVLTMYNGKRNDIKAWPILRGNDGWTLYDGLHPAAIEGEGWPRDETPWTNRVFISVEKFNDVLGKHYDWGYTFYKHLGPIEFMGGVEWPKAAEWLLDAPGPFVDPFARPCAKDYKPLKLRQRNDAYGNKGEPLPNTGYVSGLCPLYGKCHKQRLQAANVIIDPLPQFIRIESVKDEPQFARSEYEPDVRAGD